MARISKCIILADRLSKRLSPLTREKPVYMFPVFNRPLIEYTIHCLKSMEITDIMFAASKNSNALPYLESLRQKNGVSIDVRYMDDEKPRGTAGIIRDLGEFVGDENFLVVDSNTFIGDVRLNDFVDFHEKKKSIVTVAVRVAKRFFSEGINATDEGGVYSYYNIHASVERRSSLSPLGIYLFNPKALELIKNEGYFDIQEQLIPLLKESNLRMYTYEMKGKCRSINTVEDYYEVHRESLFTAHSWDGYKRIAEGIWIGANTLVSPNTYILGPALIGDDCIVETGSQIIGPAVIGRGCTIETGALVRESILWEGCTVKMGSNIRYSIAGEGLVINSGESHRNKVLVGNMSFGDINLLPMEYEFNGASGINSPRADTFRYKTYLRLKRTIDICFALFALVLFSPLIVAIAIAIKLDSEGSVIFWQKRCGKDGREFYMLKFRTMVRNAEELQEELQSQKEIDGPMFKLANDPRVTRVGKFLRKSSLDEVLQFLNILKGDMSLVGPRPLVMDEMKFCSSWRDIRLKVKPGLTGLWQVEGRSDAPFHNWVRYDLDYVENQSLWLDLKIIIKTIKAVLKRAGAY